MPSFRSEKKEYGFQKHKSAPLKNKKSFLNFKRQHEHSDDAETDVRKWIKVVCKTDNPNCMLDIIHELEEIVLRYGKKRINFQAINPMFKEGRLDFYLKVSKNDSKTLYRNCYSIERYDLKCMEFNDISIPTDFPEEWNNVVWDALCKRCSNNEATEETDVNLSNFSKDEHLAQQGLMLKMSNTHVLKNVFNLLIKRNVKSITRLNLSHNEISNIYLIKSFLESCEVLKVDLSNNRLKRTEDLKCLSSHSVMELNVENNYFETMMKQKHLQEEIRKILPGLTILNGKTLPASVNIAGDKSVSKKVLPVSVFSDKNGDVYTEFVLKYCAAFDNNTRDGICDFYSSESVLSLDCHSSDMPNCYRNNNNNIFMAKSKDSSSGNYLKGKASIVGTLAKFPKTKHIEETLNVDVAFRTSSDMMFILSGVFVELPGRDSKTYRPRQFSRTFVINNGTIIQDHICLMPSDSHLYNKFKSVIDSVKEQNECPEKYKDQPKKFSSEEVEIVRKFKLFTGMTESACLEFLSTSSSLQEASEKFTSMKEQGHIPKEAYA